mmetsp:Transcript_116027/g.291884  ORF Transcript_116027/g.291884 Transcript_116027/m.291884 type:complete len:215 (-) Transcript_116027:64-708(-)
MVIPMSAPGMQLQGPPPQEAHEPMLRLKYSVLALAGFGALRLLLAVASGLLGLEFMGLLNVFFAVSMGAFILKDDPHFEKFYKCLSTTIFQMCAERGMGGMGCLMPFLMYDAINFVFDVLTRARFLGLGLYGVALFGCMASEAASAYFAWCVYKVCQDSGPSAMEMGGGSDYVQASDGGNPRNPAMYPGSGGGGGGGGGSEFQVFSGSGNRLGG